MHLALGVPATWYRVSLRWPDERVAGTYRRATGITLPGGPALIIGSNGFVAWGLTNTEADWSDLVVVDADPSEPDTYRTPQGKRRIERREEIIQVKGEAPQKMEVVETIWGPLIDRDRRGRPLALRWVAYDAEAVNFEFGKLMQARTLDELITQANRCGGPHLNFVAGDREGRIAWTVLGRIPRRVGFSGRYPVSWSDGTCRWDGYHDPADNPRIVAPPSGRLWTANNRVVDGKAYELLGHGGYDRGVRAGRIRERLFALDRAGEDDMLDIQLDIQNRLAERWHKLLLETLTPEVCRNYPPRAEMRRFLEDWGGGRAGPESVGYRLVMMFRQRVITGVLDPLTARCQQADGGFSYLQLAQREAAPWKIVNERPAHLLDRRYKTWDDFLLACIDAVRDELLREGDDLAERTWGEVNRADFKHPLCRGVPALGHWLDVETPALPGSPSDLPRVQGPTFGVSQRMVVSPGREDEGYFHIPCGQSGHFLSPHYRDSHEAWCQGKPTPFLPGPTVHVLVLKP
jgi:penicillin amidase